MSDFRAALRKATFERSMATELLVEALLDAKIGEIVTYQDLQHLVNYDIQGKHRHLLDRARRIVQRDRGYVFATLHNIGLQRAAAHELTEIGRKQIKKAGRCAHRGAKVMDTVRRDELTPDQALEHDATRGVLAAIKNAARKKNSTPRTVASRDPQVKL